MGSTGPGGLPHTVGSMLNSVTKFQVISVPFDGEGPGITALMGGHVDMMPVGAGAATENIKAGRVKALAVVDANPMPIAGAATIPPITKDYPDFGKFLPWGPFYGVFVKRDTPDDIKATLVKAFKTAGDNPQFQTLMKERGNVLMNVSGNDADAFMKKWQSVTAWVLQEVGAAKASPDKFGIPKP
jgi:tripartite-type tricarboxylate transporter receptor subunit TctC